MTTTTKAHADFITRAAKLDGATPVRHAARASQYPGRVVLACTGRTVTAELSFTGTPEHVTCKACTAGIASGRIEWCTKD